MKLPSQAWYRKMLEMDDPPSCPHGVMAGACHACLAADAKYSQMEQKPMPDLMRAMIDLTDADRAAIAAIREQTASSSESERAAFIYRAGIAAGNKERDYMLTVIEAAKALQQSIWRNTAVRIRAEEAFIAALEGDK